MNITKKKAISECKKLWKEIEESGLSKFAFMISAAGRKWLKKGYEDECPLCELNRGKGCSGCLLLLQYKHGCRELGYLGPTREWFNAIRGLK